MENTNNKNGLAILFLFLFFPVGLYFMWKKTQWTMVVKAIITVICLFAFGQAYSYMNYQDQHYAQTLSATATPNVRHLSPTPSFLTVSSYALTSDYDNNKLAADDKYKNKTIQTEATIKDISYDLMGKSYLLMQSDAGQSGTDMQCYFDDRKSLLQLKNGETVKVQGTVSNMTLGIILLKNCSIVK